MCAKTPLAHAEIHRIYTPHHPSSRAILYTGGMDMEDKVRNEKPVREMTFRKALLGFFVPLAVLIVLIIFGADVSIASLVALFVMAIFCLLMGVKWADIDAAMAELNNQFHAMSQEMYNQSNSAQQGAPNDSNNYGSTQQNANSNGKDNVTDVDFEEVK